jgi:cytochrome c oxidase subunit II
VTAARRSAAVAAGTVWCAGCALHGAHDALAASGSQSARVGGLWWMMLAIAAVVWLLVVAVLLWGLARRRGALPDGAGAMRPDAATERRLARTVAVALAATVITLFIVLLADFRVGRALTLPPAATAVHIEVTGHQYWWEARYLADTAKNIMTTANELHVPVRTPVVFVLGSSDVIHSMWVPSLSGKKDLMPGYTRSLWFQADTPGTYRGQCAEFCGYQHAKMGMLVIAQTRADYDRWLAGQRMPAADPTDSVAKRGQKVFLGSACVMCHTVSGTLAGATNGPDLTHIASRRTIAAGTLPNTAPNLIAWISDPQRIKPGSLMPATKLDPRDLYALVTYLRQLK